MRATCRSYLCSDEPHLADVLEDPVILAMMARDGVRRAEIDALVRTVRQRLDHAEKNPALWLSS